jgi:PadR family transcriptional regulator, regulatory protein AphA
MSPRSSAALTLEHVLLALVDQKPMHGYELYQELCAMQGIDRIWNIKQALMYALLDKLERMDFLTSKLVPGEAYPPRKYFTLTPHGRSTLYAWMQTPVRRARDLRQEFLAKLIIARRYGKASAIQLIDAQLQDCQSWLEDLEMHALQPEINNVDEWFVFSFRLNRVAASMRWLEDCKREIEILPIQPLASMK